MPIKNENEKKGKRPAESIIDLTASDDEDYTFRRRKQARTDSSQTTPGPSSTGQSTSSQEPFVINDDDEDDEIQYMGQNNIPLSEAPREPYGLLSTKIVGLQYYRGMATRGELVQLRREPSNPHDPNAIRVVNMLGQQIGHIPRDVAKKLAKYVDEGSLLLEGRLIGERGAYDAPIGVELWGPVDQARRQELSARLKADKIPTANLDRALQEMEARRRQELARATQVASSIQPGMSMTSSGPGQASQSTYRRLEDIIAESGRTLNPREVGEYFEKFGMSEEDLEQLPKAKQPKRISLEMLPYQLQGLAWLQDRENPAPPEAGSKDAVQLWKHNSNGVWSNIATGTQTRKKPDFASGGILADDMGLGKTIQMISLIISDLERLSDTDPRTTLVIAPLSLLSNWRNQIANHVNPKKPLRVATYHGTSKKNYSKPSELQRFDVVLTTYGMVGQEWEPRTTADHEEYKRKTGIFSIVWRRIILDEGHHIRNPATKAANSVCALRAPSRWALTGTPIVNSLTDLCSILRFVGISGGLEQLPVFNRVLTLPTKQGNATAITLLQAVMAQFTLRRKKEFKFTNINLPKLTQHVLDVNFTAKEQEIHTGFTVTARQDLEEWQLLRQGDAEERKAAGQKYRHMFEVMLRMRQVCNHWKLCERRVTELMEILADKKSVDLTPENVDALKDLMKLVVEQNEDCAICMDSITLQKQPTITTCGHTFCNADIMQVIQVQGKCPMCRHELKSDRDVVVLTEADYDKEAKLEGAEEEEEGLDPESSKLKALLELLRSKQDEENPKIVLFSQWTSFLSLVEPHLTAAGLKFTRLDGTMNVGRRDAALKMFDDDPNCTILLASLAVASVGLNLVVANTVILCDSWWAPSIEDQAVDRIHRLGQKRECEVYKLVVKDSIEQRVLGIQEDKRALMRAAFNEGSEQDSPENREQRLQNRIRDIQILLG